MNDNEPAAPPGGGGLASSVRLRLDFGYDGTAFSGWAMQPGKRTVEDELSAALTLILRASRPVRLTVAGRTDAGVHARGAVAHVDVDPAAFALLPGRADRTPAQAALTRLNGVLPHDIVVHGVSLAPEGLHARFSATRAPLPLPHLRPAGAPRSVAPPRHRGQQTSARRRGDA